MIFADNKEYGKRLKKELIESVSNMEVEDSIYVSFITSDYTEDYEMFTQVIQITDMNKTLAKVLIATSVLDNGVNIKDINLRNLVIITDTETEFIQMLGRKRYDDSRVKLYLYKHTRDHFVKRQRQNSKRLEIAQSNYEYIYNNIKNILNSIKDKKIVDKWEETAVINQSKFLMNCLMDGNIKFEDMKTLFMGMNGLWILNVLSYQNLENLNQYYNQILEEFQNYGEDAFLKMQIRWLNKEEEEPEELENEDTEESSILEHKDFMESIKAARDVIKIQKISYIFGVKFVLLGLENQEHIHYAMPMRVMGYDYATYKKQYDSNAKKYKDRNEKEMDDDEFLSRMKKTDKFLPVITIVLYYGEKEWDGAKSLHEMLEIPEELKAYVNDYKMLLVEARENDLQFHNINNKDLFSLLEIILDSSLSKTERKEQAMEYSRKNKTDKNVAITVVGATNTKLDYNVLEKGDDGMCTLFKKIAKESEAKGIIEAGLDFGLPEQDILERVQIKLEVSLDMAKEYFKMFGKKTV